jgi:hypothetical protein
VKDINQAKVLAVGPGGLDRNGNKIPMSVATGDKVLIPQVSMIEFASRLRIAFAWEMRLYLVLQCKMLTVCLRSSVAARSRSARMSTLFSETLSMLSYLFTHP